MVRGIPIVLGAGLLVLWLAGIGGPEETAIGMDPASITVMRWIAWLDLFAGLAAFAIASMEKREQPTPRAGHWSLGVGLGLMALGIVGIVARVMGWLPLGNFIFGAVLILWSRLKPERRFMVTDEGVREVGEKKDRAA